MDAINETNVQFRGKSLMELSHEETREALIQALKEVARLQSPPLIVGWAVTPDKEPWLRGIRMATASSLA